MTKSREQELREKLKWWKRQTTWDKDKVNDYNLDLVEFKGIQEGKAEAIKIVKELDFNNFKCSKCCDAGCNDGDIHMNELKREIKERLKKR
jgi:hypothetical protein